MSQINQQLLERLSSKLNVGKAQVYVRIQAVAGQTMLDRHLAALVLASQVGVNIQKYSTPAERATIRGSLNSGTSHSSSAAVDDPIERPPKKAGKLKKVSKVKKAKDDSVFVVHGRNDELRKSMFEFLRALG